MRFSGVSPTKKYGLCSDKHSVTFYYQVLSMLNNIYKELNKLRNNWKDKDKKVSILLENAAFPTEISCQPGQANISLSGTTF